MIFGLFTLLVALTISAVAAYYSIAGLTAIFAAAVTPVIIMGAALEIGKITATIWLHKFWHRSALQFKLYLIPAIIVLMLITSMGIFGFLSKAHMDQNVTVGNSAAKVAILDEKIKTEQDNISANKRALQQMDAQVDQLLGRTTDDKGANRAVQVRKQQAKERKNIQADISEAQKRIADLQNERAPLAAETRKIEAEVGPIKYIAALIYGDNPDANLLERAVRWVIILLVLVFDPLALVLILAAEQTIEWARQDRKPNTSPYPHAPANPAKVPATPDEMAAVADGIPPEIFKEGWHQEWVPDNEQWPAYDPDDGPLTDAQIDEINRTANVQVVSTTTSLFDTEEEFFDRGKELARAIDNNNGKFPINDFSADEYLDSIEDAPANDVEEIHVEQTAEVNDDNRFDPQPINPLQKPAVLDENVRPANISFGTEFPPNPEKGDMFLRVDFLPNRSYKWNSQKWIEQTAEANEQYAYDEEYIKHLVDRIDRGEYDVELLSNIEQEQIQRYLNEQSFRK